MRDWLQYIGFFFQAEDGIRDIGVTGVQTCALPIYPRRCWQAPGQVRGRRAASSDGSRSGSRPCRKIGRASCRERVEISVVAVSLKKKNEINGTTVDHRSHCLIQIEKIS